MRIIIILLLCLVTAPSWAATTFYWRAEGTTLSCTGSPCSGDDYTAGTDTSAAATGSPAINATAALVGSNGIQINGPTEFYSLNSEDAMFNAAAGAIGFYIRIQTFGDTATIIWMRTNSGDTGDRIAVLLSTVTNNHIRFRIRASGVGTFDLDGPAMSTDTTYFVICKWDQSVNDRRIEVYDTGGSHIAGSPVEDLTTGWTNPGESYPITDGLSFGEVGGTSASYYLDNIFIATAYPDGDTIYTKRNITTWATGGSAPLFRGS